LLISLPAVRLLSTEEHQALVAHELDHEYLWDEFEAAQSQGQVQRLRRLEADCDAIAALTIARLGQKPERLVKALEKVFKYNHDRFGVALNQNRYPSLTERRASVMRLMEEFDR